MQGEPGRCGDCGPADRGGGPTRPQEQGGRNAARPHLQVRPEPGGHAPDQGFRRPD